MTNDNQNSEPTANQWSDLKATTPAPIIHTIPKKGSSNGSDATITPKPQKKRTFKRRTVEQINNDKTTESYGNTATSRVGALERDTKIATLHLLNHTNQYIANTLNLHLHTVSRVVTKLKAEIKGMSKDNLIFLIQSIYMKCIDIHNAGSAELVGQFIGTQVERDDIKRKVGTATLVDIKAVKELERLLRSQVAGIAKHDSMFVDTIQRMGVPQAAIGSDKMGPSDSAIIVDTEGKGVLEITDAAIASLERQRTHLKKVRKEHE